VAIEDESPAEWPTVSPFFHLLPLFFPVTVAVEMGYNLLREASVSHWPIAARLWGDDGTLCSP